MKLTALLSLFVVAFPLLFAGCGGGVPMPGVGPLDADTDGYSFQVRVPTELDPEENYQLVIAFHDNGQSERQVLDWWDQGLLDSPDFILLAVRAPFLGERGYNWLPRDANPGSDTDNVASARTVEELVQDGLEAVTAEYIIDEEDIILVGTGSGADVALWLEYADHSLLGRYRVSLSVMGGLVLLGEGELATPAQRDLVPVGHLGLQFLLSPRFRLHAQIDAHGDLLDSGVAQAAQAAVQGTLGGRWLFSPHGWLSFAVIEDLRADSAPDVVFQLALGRRF